MTRERDPIAAPSVRCAIGEHQGCMYATSGCHCACHQPQGDAIERIMAEYRSELLDGMHRYHGCDLYNNERACRADVYRIDRVILPVVRKMLEDAMDLVR